MKKYRITALAALALAAGCCGTADAAPIVLPTGDSLNIQLTPGDGVVAGAYGAFVGWGFIVDWAPQGANWITFTGADISFQSNQSVADGPLIPFVSWWGGPDPVEAALSPTYGPWMQAFDYAARTGIAAFHITSDPNSFLADDRGRMRIVFDVYDGPPTQPTSSIVLNGNALEYYVDFTVNVVPEPGSFGLLAIGCGALAVAWCRRLA